MDIALFLESKIDCTLTLNQGIKPSSGGIPVTHYFANGDKGEFKISRAETVPRSLTRVFGALISDPAKTIKDIPNSDVSAKGAWQHPIGAVYNSDYKLVPESQFRKNQILPNETHERPTRKLPGTWVFLGYYNEVYGHFILESLCRLWALDFLKDITVKFFYLPIRDYTEFKGHYTEPFFQKFDDVWKGPGKFSDLIEFITEPVMMEDVIIPSRSFDIQGGPRADYLDIIDKIMPSPAIIPRKIRLYLSRKSLRLGQHKFVNEAEVENVFRSYGFKVLNPEDLSIKKQLRAYSQAESIAGAISSALHNSIFSPAGCYVIAMNGRWPQTGRIAAAKANKNFPNPVCPQDRICGEKSQCLSYIENQRVFDITGLLSGRMPYFIGPLYCHELVGNILNETVDASKLTNGFSDAAAKVTIMEAAELALNGNALSLADQLINMLENMFEQTADMKKSIKRVKYRRRIKERQKAEDTGRKFTLFPDSGSSVADQIIAESAPLAADVLRKLRGISSTLSS